MAELSLFWDGSTLGDCGPYADEDIMDTYFRAITNSTPGAALDQGVLVGWANEFDYSFAANTVIVDTGAAMIYGLFYENDAALNVNIPNGPRTDLIVIRRSWGAATARITRIAGPGAAVTQNYLVTYDIPLYTVDVDAFGTVVLNTDLRDYCEFSTTLPDASVGTDNIQDGAVGISELINQVRWISRGAGTLEPDSASPASWTVGPGLPNIYRDSWEFADGGTEAVWMTFRVPEDLSGATMDIYLWLSWNENPATGAVGNQEWGYSLQSAASGAAFANQTNTQVIAESLDTWRYQRAARFLLDTVNATAGDIMHCQIYRNGGAAADTSDASSFLFMVEISYTADS